MEEVIEKIKEKIAACKHTGDMFNLPSLPDSIVVVNHQYSVRWGK